MKHGNQKISIHVLLGMVMLASHALYPMQGKIGNAAYASFKGVCRAAVLAPPVIVAASEGILIKEDWDLERKHPTQSNVPEKIVLLVNAMAKEQGINHPITVCEKGYLLRGFNAQVNPIRFRVVISDDIVSALNQEPRTVIQKIGQASAGADELSLPAAKSLGILQHELGHIKRQVNLRKAAEISAASLGISLAGLKLINKTFKTSGVRPSSRLIGAVLGGLSVYVFKKAHEKVVPVVITAVSQYEEFKADDSVVHPTLARAMIADLLEDEESQWQSWHLKKDVAVRVGPLTLGTIAYEKHPRLCNVLAGISHPDPILRIQRIEKRLAKA